MTTDLLGSIPPRSTNVQRVEISRENKVIYTTKDLVPIRVDRTTGFRDIVVQDLKDEVGEFLKEVVELIIVYVFDKIVEWVKKQLEEPVDPVSAPTAQEPAPPIEEKAEVSAEFRVELNAKDPSGADKPTDKPTDTPTNTPTDTPTDTPTETPTDTPTDTDNGVAPAGGGGGTGDGDVKVAPEDGGATPPTATQAFDRVMKEFLSMTFDTAEAAAAFLQQSAEDTGITITLTGDGLEVSDPSQDPLGIAERLRGEGLRDDEVIQGVVDEVNGAVRDLESFIRGVQGTVAAAATTSDDATAGANGTGSGQAPFLELLPEWAALAPSGSVVTIATPPSGQPGAPIETELIPTALLSIRTETPSGQVLELSLNTQIVKGISQSDSAGYHVGESRSIFDDVDTRQLRA